MLNQLPPNVFDSLKTDFLDNNKGRLALVCSVGDRYRGLGGDAVASLQAGAALLKQQEVEEAVLGRIRVSYRVARKDYSRCWALGIPGRGYCVVAKEYGTVPVLLHHFITREHQEGLDSTEADEVSLDKESSTGDF